MAIPRQDQRISAVLWLAIDWAEEHSYADDYGQRKELRQLGDNHDPQKAREQMRSCPECPCFKPSLGDRMIMRRMAEALVYSQDSGIIHDHWGVDILYLYYYPEYYHSILRYRHE